MSTKFSDGKDYIVIALCMTQFTGYDQQNLIKEMGDRCAARNVKMMIFSSVTDLYNGGLNDIGEGQIFSLMDVSRFDAVVIMSETFKQEDVLRNLVNRAQKANVPVISIDRYIKGCININYDYSEAFEKIVRHIVEDHHCKRINFIAGFEGNDFSDERLNCYKKVLEENGIPVEKERIGYGNFWADPTRAVVEEFLASDMELPEAIICANDIMAIECMRTLKKHGYRIPEDIMVTGFDGIDLEQYFTPRLTTAEFDIEALCNAILDAVNRCREEKNGQGEDKIIVKYRFREGASCGCKDIRTVNVEDKLFEENFIIDHQEVFQTNMFNMIAKLSNYPDMHYIFNMIPGFYEEIDSKEYWMCFNNNFTDERYDVNWAFNREDSSYSNYTDYMRVPLHTRGKEVSVEPDVAREELLPDMDGILSRTDFLMFVPIHLQGFTVGYMVNLFDADKFNARYYLAFLLNFRHILEIYVNRATQERLYVCDVLTRIYNRHGFYRNVGGAFKASLQNKIPFTIISIDMDGLKYINDNFGHAEGDFALQTIACCMQLATSGREICSRFGGDEFVIAFSDERGEARAKEIAQQIEDDLERFNNRGEKPYPVRASIGIFTRIPQEGATIDDFIKVADDLMYENKKEHKSRR